MVTLNDLVEMQKTYWKFDDREYQDLLKRYPHNLSWAKKLRLHHLHCVKFITIGAGQSALTDQAKEPSAEDRDYKFYKELVLHLSSQQSPYKARICSIWQGDPQRSKGEQGLFRNASTSHLGCVEVIRLNQYQKPTEVAFVSLDDLGTIGFADSALFRMAKVFYDTGQREEIVIVPLLYGLSWLSNKPHLQNGSFTNLFWHIQVDHLSGMAGLGLGHQDFAMQINPEQSSLVGLGSIAQITTALDLNDPRFDQKCRARGINPDTVRRQIPKQ